MLWNERNESLNNLTRRLTLRLCLLPVKNSPFELWEKWFDSDRKLYRLVAQHGQICLVLNCLRNPRIAKVALACLRMQAGTFRFSLKHMERGKSFKAFSSLLWLDLGQNAVQADKQGTSMTVDSDWPKGIWTRSQSNIPAPLPFWFCLSLFLSHTCTHDAVLSSVLPNYGLL